jgi:hypothetical protein
MDLEKGVLDMGGSEKEMVLVVRNVSSSKSKDRNLRLRHSRRFK